MTAWLELRQSSVSQSLALEPLRPNQHGTGLVKHAHYCPSSQTSDAELLEIILTSSQVSFWHTNI